MCVAWCGGSAVSTLSLFVDYSVYSEWLRIAIELVLQSCTRSKVTEKKEKYLGVIDVKIRNQKASAVTVRTWRTRAALPELPEMKEKYLDDTRLVHSSQGDFFARSWRNLGD